MKSIRTRITVTILTGLIVLAALILSSCAKSGYIYGKDAGLVTAHGRVYIYDCPDGMPLFWAVERVMADELAAMCKVGE
jgi:hypothetical protein